MLTANDHLTDAPLVVLLHGYGADERDLAGLVPYLPGHYRYASLRAPEPVPGMPGHQWFSLRWLPGPAGPTLDTSAEAEAVLNREVTAAARDLLDRIAALGAERVAFIGFSQGAVAGMQAWRLDPDRFVCGVVLSGFVASGEVAGDAVLAERRPPVFWGRGDADPVIPQAAIEFAGPWLDAHTTLERLVIPGAGHEVTFPELNAVAHFLDAQLR